MARGPVLEVLDPGLLLTVQDGGRDGLAAEGITRGGAADTWSLAVANVLVGNPPDAAALEATVLGPTLRALRRVTVGLAGRMAARVAETGAVVAAGTSVLLAPGHTLVLDPAAGGARAYLAIPGGVDVPVVLGSRSTAIGAGFGGHEGRPLRTGDILATNAEYTAPLPTSWSGDPAPGPVTPASPLRVIPGPHASDAALAALASAPWVVTATSDRVGLRLDGGRVPVASNGELASHGVVVGSIQVPPDGMPIVLLPDHQPTGGYPVVAVVITADLARLGQLGPAARVGFAPTTSDDARLALRSMDGAFGGAAGALREAAGWDALWQEAGR
jgi:biotin-dependent carboxylase-like uncharacterized protein